MSILGDRKSYSGQLLSTFRIFFGAFPPDAGDLLSIPTGSYIPWLSFFLVTTRNLYLSNAIALARSFLLLLQVSLHRLIMISAGLAVFMLDESSYNIIARLHHNAR